MAQAAGKGDKWFCTSGHGKRIQPGTDEHKDATEGGWSYCKRCGDTVSGRFITRAALRKEGAPAAATGVSLAVVRDSKALTPDKPSRKVRVKVVPEPGTYAAYVLAVKAEQTAYRGWRRANGARIRAMGTDYQEEAKAKSDAAWARLAAAMTAKAAARAAYDGPVG